MAEKTSFSRSIRWPAVKRANQLRGIEHSPRQTTLPLREPAESGSIFSSQCHAEQAGRQGAPQTWFSKRMIMPRPASTKPGRWWSRTGSNRRPPACKAGALPAELRPHVVSPKAMTTTCDRRFAKQNAESITPLEHASDSLAAFDAGLRPRQPRSAALSWWAWEDLNLRPHAYQARALTN